MEKQNAFVQSVEIIRLMSWYVEVMVLHIPQNVTWKLQLVKKRGNLPLKNKGLVVSLLFTISVLSSQA